MPTSQYEVHVRTKALEDSPENDAVANFMAKAAITEIEITPPVSEDLAAKICEEITDIALEGMKGDNDLSKIEHRISPSEYYVEGMKVSTLLTFSEPYVFVAEEQNMSLAKQLLSGVVLDIISPSDISV